ncbi:DNA-directed RNA polymerase subunit beta [Loigolactobacillus iwatensis]|uniref:DNA-directed RNA polymerase subunit beta n=1 Tax=Loigolactobacillus iwatensis TaxID=1267156 RepID=UPI000F7D6328|nr:DNA-directed RNA polymerase subunit beta [Loigolactobacillus iwatensis]
MRNSRRFDVFVRPVLSKILLVAILMLVTLVLGTMIGFAIGGGNPLRVFLPSTWGHMLDFVQ